MLNTPKSYNNSPGWKENKELHSAERNRGWPQHSVEDTEINKSEFSTTPYGCIPESIHIVVCPESLFVESWQFY